MTGNSRAFAWLPVSLRRPCTAIAILIAAAVAAAASVESHADPAGGDSSDAKAAQRGRVLIERYHCGSCHTVPGVAGAQGTLAVALNAYGRRSYIAGRVANQPGLLARWIIEPAAVVPGTTMPSMGVSASDASDIAAYLGSLR